MVPFFYVAKGDSIPKHIQRQKPAINNNEAVILFSTINDNSSKLKATGVTDGANYSWIQKDPITYLYVSIRRDNSVGDWLWDNLRKIPVDLNEGAGGKWIYLFYSRKKPTSVQTILLDNPYHPNGSKFLPINFLTVIEGRPGPYLDAVPGSYLIEGPEFPESSSILGTSFPDLNDGAGGAYLYFMARKCITQADRAKYGEPIVDIMIVSANTSDVNYPGWQKIDIDLNKGAGGKYIYLFYRRLTKMIIL